MERHQSDLKAVIADFGAANSIRNPGELTEYIVTRWYRAPEIVLKPGYYDEKVDMWSFGCVLYEMMTNFGAFRADSEVNLISSMMSQLGKPSQTDLLSIC